MMMVSFAATIILGSNDEQDWTNIFLYTITFFPVIVFVLAYVGLYKLLVEAIVERLKEVIALMVPTADVQLPQPSQALTTSVNEARSSLV